MTQQHTPTPWEASLDMDGRHKGFSIMANWHCDGSEPYHPLIARTLHGNGNAPMEVARANAAFIVRACNAHDELIYLLQKTLDYINPTAHVLRSKIETALSKAKEA